MLPKVISAWGGAGTADSAHIEETIRGRSACKGTNFGSVFRPTADITDDKYNSSNRNEEGSFSLQNRVEIEESAKMSTARASIVDNDGGVFAKPTSPLKTNLLPLKKHPTSKRQRRIPRRQRQRTDKENDLFTSFTLNRDPENSKYLPYDEVVYPRIFNRPREARRAGESAYPGGECANTRDRSLDLAAAAELDGMWVVGFVENARRHHKDLLLRELRDFVRLPGSSILPAAHTALATISQMEKPTSFNSSKATSSTAEGRPGSTSESLNDRKRDGGENDRCSRSTERETSGGMKALTALERLRLRELEKRLSQESLGVREEDERRHAGIQAYKTANRKLRKILRGTQPPSLGPSIKSQGLEAVFRRNREEIAAAIRIQRLYKRYYRRKRFERLSRQLRGIVRIQAFARGVIARRFVAEWYSRRSVMVLAWQTAIRRMLSNMKWRRRLVVEQRAASKLQAVVRGRSGREKARQMKTDIAALRIQCLWRGSVDRARVDRLWLGSLATRIQGLARMMVAKRVVERTRRIYNVAAKSIQRCFRGTVARGAMVRLIWERSMNRRLDFLRVLAAEEEWERENMELTQRRSQRMMLEEKLEEATAAEKKAHAEVFELEVSGCIHQNIGLF